MIGARDHGFTGFNRLTKAVERLRGEFWQLIEEQDAEMGETDLAGPRARAAADEGCHARRMVGGAERAIN